MLACGDGSSNWPVLWIGEAVEVPIAAALPALEQMLRLSSSPSARHRVAFLTNSFRRGELPSAP